MYDLWKSLITEFLGTFVLVFVGASASAYALQNGANPLTIALAFGLAYIALIYIFNSYSGANFNPAISFGLAISGRLGWCRMILYWIMQFLGALAAAALVGYIYDAKFGLASPMVHNQPWKVVVLEMILTFFLVLVFLFMTRNPYVAMISGFVIGLTLTACLLVGGGAFIGLNPAYGLAASIFSQKYTNLWVFIVGPLFGAIIAGLIYRAMLYPWSCNELETLGCNHLCGQEVFYEEHKDCSDPEFMERGRATYEARKAELEMNGDMCTSPCDAPKCETKCGTGILGGKGKRGYKYSPV